MSFTQLNQIPAFAELNSTDYACAICLEQFQEGEEAFAHDGQGGPHIFHLACLNFWIGTNPSCPTCRLPITSVNGAAIEQPLEEEEEEEIDGDLYLFTVAGWGNLVEVVNFLFGTQQSSDCLGSAVIEVVRRANPNDWQEIGTPHQAGANHVAILEALLANGPILDEDRGTAVRWTAALEGTAMLELLLASGNISTTNRSYALLGHALQGNLRAVELLIADGPIFEIHRNQARAAILGSNLEGAQETVALIQGAQVTQE